MTRLRVLAIVPARGGSKGIPHKNIVDINGKPLIAWSIAQAQDSGRIDYIHVSTDDAEIAAAARTHGASCEFLRPAELAGDRIGTGEALRHAIDELARRGHHFDAVVELQPTYCFRGSSLVADCVDALAADQGVSAIITCTKVEDTSHPDFVMGLEAAGRIRFGSKRPDQFARQFLSPAFACKGIALVGRMASYRANCTFYAGDCRAIVVHDPIRMLDINGPLDLEIARFVAGRHPDYLR